MFYNKSFAVFLVSSISTRILDLQAVLDIYILIIYLYLDNIIMILI